MKKLLLLVTSLVSFLVNSQTILTENCSSLTVGNVGSDLSGATLGQGGWRIFSTVPGSTSLSDLAVVNVGGTHGKAFQITGSNTASNTKYIYKDAIASSWSSRTSGNDIAQVEYEFFSGPITTSKNSMRVVLYDNTGTKMLAGLMVAMDTKIVSGLAYYNNAGTLGNFSFGMGATLAAPIVLTPNTWYKFGFSFNKTTGQVRWRESTGLFNKVTSGASVGLDVSQFDILASAGTGNSASSLGVFDNFKAKATNTDELFISKLANSSCGVSIPSLSSIIASTSLGGVTQYRFEVTNTTTSAIQTIDKATHWFRLTDLSSYDYATTYSIKVKLQVDGVWYGLFGAPCLVTTPSAPTITSPTCNSTVSFNTTITTSKFSSVTGYRFRVTNITPGYSGLFPVQTVDKSVNWFRLNELSEYLYGANYKVEVAIKTTGAYLPFTAFCNFNTPSVPQIDQCGATLNSGNLVTTTSLSDVSQYTFEVKNLNTLSTQTINSATHYFSTNLITGYSSSVPYSVKIALTTTGVQSAFGAECTINPLPAPRKGNSLVSEFKVNSYPNPFNSTFTLDIYSVDNEKIEISVYDMIGKLYQKIELNDSKSIEIGNDYPNGIYNIIINQNDKIESIRMIKK